MARPGHQLPTTGHLATTKGRFPLLWVDVEDQMQQDATVTGSFWQHQGYEPWVARQVAGACLLAHVVGPSSPASPRRAYRVLIVVARAQLLRRGGRCCIVLMAKAQAMVDMHLCQESSMSYQAVCISRD